MTQKSVSMFLKALFGGALFLSGVIFSEVQAADPFDGIKMSPAAKTYLVLKDVNVRQKPKTKSSRVGRFRRNVQIKAVGKAKGTEWVAVQKDGKNYGFVYGTALSPMIDGKLSAPLKGNIEASALGGQKFPPCHYKIHFDRKIKVEGDLQITSDYQLSMQCDYNSKTIKIDATMFITELPYLDPRKPIYQINVDLSSMPIEDEDVFSVTTLYHLLRNELNFDSVNSKEMKSVGKIEKLKVEGLQEALKGAVRMAYRSWGPKIWLELAKNEEP